LWACRGSLTLAINCSCEDGSHLGLIVDGPSSEAFDGAGAGVPTTLIAGGNAQTLLDLRVR
jgi:hypothetical protein